jgi:capsid assembly protease
MHYTRILSAFYGTPWAILPSKLLEIRAWLQLKARGGDVPRAEVAAIVQARRPAEGVQMANRVAVVQCFGTICHHAGSLDEFSGGVSTERLGNTLDGLVADKQVKCVLCVFDSPGGSVAGVPELAAKIRGYRGEKKVYGICDGMAASAAYWLASQCAELYCTPSSQVGNIGVISAHEDLSKQLEEEGIKMTLVHAGKYKVEGNPYEELGDEARADWQAKVDYYYSQFCGDVAAGRGVSVATVKKDYGEGRMMTSAEAKKAGMVDRVCTVEECLQRIGGSGVGDGAKAEAWRPSVEALQRRLRLEE